MAKYPITNMTANELLEYLQNGAVLSSRWIYGKRINRLQLPTKETLFVQKSNISALLNAKAIYGIPLSGDNYQYRLIDKS